jgi:flagellar basal body-associated protein FliL
MSEPNASKSEEIPLEDIDRLLATEDPEFAKSLEEVRAVDSNKEVIIEADAIDEGLVVDEQIEVKPEGRLARWRHALRMRLMTMKARAKHRLMSALSASVVFIRTRPKELLLYLIAMARATISSLQVPVKAFRAANRWQRLGALAMILCFVAALWVLLANVKGVWLPQLNPPILHSFVPLADHLETFDRKDPGQSFYTAFPQERHEFLFPKMKVNLKRTAENPLPMGAFEVIVLLDSSDTAVEVHDREVEFSDLLQRVFEDETFPDLETEIGKNTLKSHLKRELNQKLTQGWVKDVNFKTFILKP